MSLPGHPGGVAGSARGEVKRSGRRLPPKLMRLVDGMGCSGGKTGRLGDGARLTAPPAHRRWVPQASGAAITWGLETRPEVVKRGGVYVRRMRVRCASSLGGTSGAVPFRATPRNPKPWMAGRMSTSDCPSARWTRASDSRRRAPSGTTRPAAAHPRRPGRKPWASSLSSGSTPSSDAVTGCDLADRGGEMIVKLSRGKLSPTTSARSCDVHPRAMPRSASQSVTGHERGSGLELLPPERLRPGPAVRLHRCAA